MKAIAVVQARMDSTRLPGKVLMKIGDRPMLQRVIERTQRIHGLDEIIVATGARGADQPIADLCVRNNIECFRGSSVDVLNRYYQCAKDHKADIVLRITADCPLLDPAINTHILGLLENGKADYSCAEGYPNGLTQEAITMRQLYAAWELADLPDDREHVVTWTLKHGKRILRTHAIGDWPTELRFSVDTPEDLAFITTLHELEPELFDMTAREICDAATHHLTA